MLDWLNRFIWKLVRENPVGPEASYPVHLTLHLAPREEEPDITATVRLGRVDFQNEVVLADGMVSSQDNLSIPLVASLDIPERLIGRVLHVSRVGDTLAFAIRFLREPDGELTQFHLNFKSMAKEGFRFHLDLGLLTVESRPATRQERRKLNVPWTAESPRVFTQWKLIAISLRPDPAREERALRASLTRTLVLKFPPQEKLT